MSVVSDEYLRRLRVRCNLTPSGYVTAKAESIKKMLDEIELNRSHLDRMAGYGKEAARRDARRAREG